jgi:hypothetical protein
MQDPSPEPTSLPPPNMPRSVRPSFLIGIGSVCAQNGGSVHPCAEARADYAA